MFILTGESGQYEDRTFQAIAVSEDKEKLERLQSHIEVVGKLHQYRSNINFNYINSYNNQQRINAATQEELLSKDHLPMTAGNERYQINCKNNEIQQRNFESRNLIWQQINKEAGELAVNEIPMTKEQEALIQFANESYSINEIMEVK